MSSLSAPASDVVITLDGVRKEFGDFVAVQDANFSIRRGEFFSLLGPSGCGKTTILKMIAGFEQPTAGKVLLEGGDVSSVPPYKRNVNTVFQQYALFPHMSVLENVEFGLRSKHVAAPEARKRAKDMLDVVRLGEFGNRRPAQLSGGQQQRVALARALVNMPSALLLDEPLAALDLKLREAMQIELKRIQREVGITFIFVTHDQGEALTMSDRIAVMSRGRVEQIGTPEEIYNSPASIFVAGFIGSANLLPGIIDSTGAAPALVLDSGRRLSLASTGPFSNGDAATLMLRPERLHGGEETGSEGRSLECTILQAIFQGSVVRLVVRSEEGLELIATADAGSNVQSLAPGTPITLRWSENAGLLLKGRSAVVGATTTDVDEVQASLDGASAASAAAHSGDEPVDRRKFIVGGGIAAAAAIAGIVIATRKSGSSTSAATTTTPTTSASTTTAPGGSTTTAATGSTVPGGTPTTLPNTMGLGDKSLRILNWQAYIDPTDSKAGTVGSVDRFSKQFNIKTNYSETLNDNNEFYAKEMEPYLGKGKKANWDIVTPTYWMAARLKKLEWIEPVPWDLVPNHVNLLDRFANDQWNKGGVWSLPWQSGTTGIAYNPKLTGRELTSMNDLFDPAFKGKVAMLTEMRDSVGLTMLALGLDPRVLDEAGANKALDKIQELNNAGQFRAFTGNEYLQSLQTGDFVACLAWSGDIVQLQTTNPEIQYVIPKEGGMTWYDTMLIPKGAPNGVAAAKWMNFVYDPVNAAQITAYVQYISPVKGVQDELRKMGGDAAKLADSPILFPDEAALSKLNIFAELPDDVDARLTARFTKITGG